jgi:hypothetical protein
MPPIGTKRNMVSSQASDEGTLPSMKPVAARSSINRKLSHLPSVEGDNSFAGLDTSVDGVLLESELAAIPYRSASQSSNAGLFDDDDFGMVQPSPISSSYSGTPQGGSYDSFEESGNFEPISTRIDDSESFSPLAAGTFAAGETGAFVPIGNTGAFSVDTAGEADIFINDADDSSFGPVPTSGDFGGPSNIDIPESRTHKLLDNVTSFFSRDKKKNKSDKAINEWLEVDENFEATSAGRDIGSWDNFSDGQEDEYTYEPEDDVATKQGRRRKGSSSEDEFLSDDDYLSDSSFKWKGGGASSRGGDTHEQVAKIRDSVIAQSNNDLFNKEIWFVALGASGSDHAGIKSFLAAHSHELAGATFINLECVGAGELSFIENEGIGFTRTADHRLQGLIHKISRATGIDIVGRQLTWRTTDLTPALRAGFRGITFMAFDGVAPVAWHQKTDTTAVIEPECIEATKDLIVEIIRNS